MQYSPSVGLILLETQDEADNIRVQILREEWSRVFCYGSFLPYGNYYL